MFDFIKKYQSSIGYSLLIIVAIVIFVFRMVYRNVGFNTLYDEAYFLFKLGDAYNGIIEGNTQWNFLAIHLFPYLNLYDKGEAYLANVLLHIASVIFITIATCYKKNGEKWLKYSALYCAVYTLSMYVNQELTYVSLVVFFQTLVVSLCLILRRCEKKLEIALCCIGIGMVVPLSIFSILPSGALILLCVFILLLSLYWQEWEKFRISVLSGIAGIVISGLVIHLWIMDLGDVYVAMQRTAQSITKVHSGYDPFSFLLQIGFACRDWLLTICICIGAYAITHKTNNMDFKWLNNLGAYFYVAVILIYYCYQSKPQTSEAFLFSAIAIIPLFYLSEIDLSQHKVSSIVFGIFLLAFPVIASLGTNVYLGQRMGCFMFSYIVFLSLLPKKIGPKKEVVIAAFLILLVPSFRTIFETMSHKNAMVYYQNSDSPISNILLEPSQIDYFNRVDSILETRQFNKNVDYTLAVNEDFATLYALNLSKNIRPYGAEDIIYTTKYDSIIPQCIFIAQWEVDMIVSATTNKWSAWGFPDAYESIAIGSPDAYRGKNTDRLLYIRK